MNPDRLSSSRGPAVAFGMVAALVAACGGGGDDGVTVLVDAQPIDAQAIDAPVCSGMVCSGTCLDTTTDEQNCGGCGTVCEAGKTCQASACACAPSFLDSMPSFIQSQISTTLLPGATLGIGGILDNTINALVVGYPTATVRINQPYTLSGATLGTPPFVAAGYDVDIQSFTPAASFYATTGTLTFTAVCAGGFQGNLTNARFVAVEGLMNPTLVPNGCAFDVPMVTFSYGTACPQPN